MSAPISVRLSMLLLICALCGCATHRLPPLEGPGSQVASFEYVWARVGETYPHTDMRGVDWQGLHDELLPAAEAAAGPDELRPVLWQLFEVLGDSHFAVIPGDRYDDAISLDHDDDEVDPPSGDDDDSAGGDTIGDDDDSADADAAVNDPGADDDGPELDDDDDPGDHGTCGLDVRLVDGVALVTGVHGPAADAGVALGWQVTRVGSREVAEYIEGIAGWKDDPRQQAWWVWRRIRSSCVGEPGTSVTMTLQDPEGADHEVTLKRVPQPGTLATLGNMPGMVVDLDHRLLADGRIGYVHFNAFMVPAPVRFTGAVREFIAADVAGVVIDLRGNPGGIAVAARGMAGHFIDDAGVSLGTLTTRDTALSFFVVPRVRSQRFEGPVAVIVDPLTGSTSELMAAGMQEVGRVRVFGETSAGKALPSIFERLPNGDGIQIVVADLTTAGGKRIEGPGVVPDVEVRHSRESLAAGRDAALDAAVAWIEEQAPPVEAGEPSEE
jgi:carboxyl-terminal processing protease